MKYAVQYRGAVIREFDNPGDLDSYLADRVFEWTELSPEHLAYVGQDYIDLTNDRGTTVRLTFTPTGMTSFESDDSFGEWLPFE